MIEFAKTRYTDTFYFYKNDQFIGQSIKLYGEYTQKEIFLLEHFIDKDSVVYDIGGNIGYHTVAFSSLAKEVHTFEPNQKNFYLLEKNTEKLKNVYLYNCACSDANGRSKISDYNLDEVGNFGQCEMTSRDGVPAQECLTIMLDDLILPLPDVMKIDVEGHESRVIKGAYETIKRSNPVILYESMSSDGFSEIYRMLTGLSYKLYWFPVHNFNPSNYNQNQENIFLDSGVVNILAMPSGVPVNGLDMVESEYDTPDVYISRRFGVKSA